MKYARLIDGRLSEVVDIPVPVPFGGDAIGFLGVMFPGIDDFFEVDDGNVSGATPNNSGGFDNPSIPVPQPDHSRGRDLLWDQFLDVAMAVEPLVTNNLLTKMPVIGEFGRKYLEYAGIQFADMSTPSSRLARLISAAKSANLVDDQFLAAFAAKWCLLYPAMR